MSHPQGVGNASPCQLLSRSVISDCKIQVKLPRVSYSVVVAGLGSFPSFCCVCTSGWELHEQIKRFEASDYEARNMLMTSESLTSIIESALQIFRSYELVNKT